MTDKGKLSQDWYKQGTMENFQHCYEESITSTSITGKNTSGVHIRKMWRLSQCWHDECIVETLLELT